MKPRHKRLDKGMKPLHKSMDKSMKKLHKSMRGGGEKNVAEQIQNQNGNYYIKVSRTAINGPIDILLFNEGNEYNPPNQTMNYVQSQALNFRTDNTNNNYLITDVDDSTLKEFLRYTDSMSNDNNVEAILTEINKGL